VSYKFLL